MSPRPAEGGRFALALATCVLLVLLSVQACTRSDNSSTTTAAAQVEQRSGPLTVTLRVDRNTITTTDRLTLTIDTTLQPGATVTPPTIPEKLGEWTITDRHDSGARRTPDGSLHNQLHLTLEPFLAGAYEIPPLEFTYKTDATANDIGKLTTQALPITVTSVLDEEPKKLAVSPPRPPLSLPLHSTTLWLASAVAAATLFAVAGGVIAYRRLRPRTAPPAEWQIARLTLARATENPGPLPWPASLDNAARALEGFLREELRLGAGTVTPSDLEGKESFRLRLGHQAYDRALALLRTLESLRFGAGELDEPARRELITGILSITGGTDPVTGGAA